MTGLRRAAEDYLAMRRALGFKLTTQGRQLMSFVDYCESRGSDRIASDLALEWATTTRSGSTHDGYLARRLMSVRIFARHYQTLDPDSEIPPEDALPHHKCRITPYLYSPGEIAALIDAAAQLTPPLRAATWQTLIGLLAVTGMRKSEACRLDDDHVDLDAATLVILDSKFGKSRRLFLHDSTVTALRDYRRRRDLWLPRSRSGKLLRLHSRHPTGRVQPHSHLRGPPRGCRDRAARSTPPTNARSAPRLYRRHIVGPLPRRR